MLKTLDIVIVNWNSGSQLKDCVESVMKSSYSNVLLNKVLVVDNSSQDNSLELIKDLSFKKLEIKKNKDNLGFGKACNIGAKKSTSDFILFLNPDAMVYKDTFKKLFHYINSHNTDQSAIYGVQLIGDDGKIQKTCARFPTLWSFTVRILGLNKINSKIFKNFTMQEWDHEDTQTVDQVIGAFFMIKREVFQELCGFDERYFVYYEELDLSKRANIHGYESIYITEAKAYHKGGGVSEQVKAHRLFYSTRSSIIYSIKHFGLFQGFILLLLSYLVEPLTRTLFLLLKHSPKTEIIQMYQGFIMLYKDTVNIIHLGRLK